MWAFLQAILVAVIITACSSNYVPDAEWADYVDFYNKSYVSTTAENNARYYYAVNKDKINTFNKRVSESYTLGINQFTDLRFLDFAALFPPTTDLLPNSIPYKVPNGAPPASFSYPAQGFSSPVQDQGQVCNSGWAYAAATAVQIYDAVANGNLNSLLLSAQNFIDCAGTAKSCINQVPQVAFDYLTLYEQRVYPEDQYPNEPLIGQGMCIIPSNNVNAKTLTSYSIIANGKDTDLKAIINYAAPVVIGFNPGSFEFMHYKEGVFTQPEPTQTAKHYMTVVGYDTDTVRAKDYWLIQNSFGTTWGENGFIRIERNAAKPITSSAIFPSV